MDGTRYSPYLRPTGMLHTLEETEFQGTMERNRETLLSLETVRKWLQQIGATNRKLLGEVFICCSEEDAGQLLEIATIRFDFGTGCLTKSATYPLLSGWEWTGPANEADVACFANERYGAGLRHYKFALTN
ncbi:Hypothetical predicted protein [Lecanosticta acicola]|uniref:Uncharacterized protein n=1 Tax=Lecanosticta acicola TaxID=111012 RepID=A0AAI8Z220_9PEZI|nr:Hypothetical predicted protein [Lecanosticta acicola]